jgi:hypothetical protein
MTRQYIWIAGIVLVVVLVGVAFMLSVPHTHDVALQTNTPAATSTPVVAIHSVYSKGLYTISGSFTVPNACTILSAAPSPLGNASTTQAILVSLSFEAATGICLQLPTSMPFQTTFSGPAHLPIQVTVNGAQASTTSS